MDVIHLIEDYLGIKSIINFQPIQPGDVFETFADIEYSKQKLDFQPKNQYRSGN